MSNLEHLTKCDNKKIVLDHGTGAKLSRELVELIVSVLGDVYIGEMEDSAVLKLEGDEIAITTDSFVIDPLFFGNGDIGKVAVCGTVNDLSVVGATPLYITLAIIVETGFPFSELIRILKSIRTTAQEARVKIVAGDTKVVREGEVDKIFINTTGVGVFKRKSLRMRHVQIGDKIILSGQIGNHTIHLLSIREGLGFETRVLSDCAPLNGMIDMLLTEFDSGAIRSIRDVTRGGLGAVLHEYAHALGKTLRVEQSSLPLQAEMVMAADMLGVNPLHLANEGCLCLFVDPEHVETVISCLKRHKYGRDAIVIGEVFDSPSAKVQMVDYDNRFFEIEELEGAELPRLC